MLSKKYIKMIQKMSDHEILSNVEYHHITTNFIPHNKRDEVIIEELKKEIEKRKEKVNI